MKLTLKNIVSVLFLATSSVQAVRLEVKSSSLWTKFRRWARRVFSPAFFALANLVPGRVHSVQLEVGVPEGSEEKEAFSFKAGPDPMLEEGSILPAGIEGCQAMRIEDLSSSHQDRWLKVIEHMKARELSFPILSFDPKAESLNGLNQLLSFISDKPQVQVQCFQENVTRHFDFKNCFWGSLLAKGPNLCVEKCSVFLDDFFDRAPVRTDYLVSFSDCEFTGTDLYPLMCLKGFGRDRKGSLEFWSEQKEKDSEILFGLRGNFLPLKEEVKIAILDKKNPQLFLRFDFTKKKILLNIPMLAKMMLKELGNISVINQEAMNLFSKLSKRLDLTTEQRKMLSDLLSKKDKNENKTFESIRNKFLEVFEKDKQLQNTSSLNSDFDDRRSVYSKVPLKNTIKEDSDHSQDL